MAKVSLLLGGNIGDVQMVILKATFIIDKQIGPVLRMSSFYKTAAWGNEKQPDFINQVLVVETELSPNELMKKVLDIEQKLGRTRSIKNAPRTIDIDILFYDHLIIDEENLIIPHPKIAERRFVLVPLNEVNSKYKHPILNKNVHQLLLECKDLLAVEKLS